jgi:hypothetical protein
MSMISTLLLHPSCGLPHSPASFDVDRGIVSNQTNAPIIEIELIEIEHISYVVNLILGVEAHRERLFAIIIVDMITIGATDRRTISSSSGCSISPPYLRTTRDCNTGFAPPFIPFGFDRSGPQDTTQNTQTLISFVVSSFASDPSSQYAVFDPKALADEVEVVKLLALSAFQS